MYTNQDIYEGEFIDGKANGFGKYIQKDGTQYESYWINSQPHGRGEMRNLDGSFYSGEYVNG